MRGVKEEFKLLDSMLRQENKLENPAWLAVISASYLAAENQNPCACELADRRYRKHEHRLTTCHKMFISEPNYYRLLGAFLKIAKSEHERLSIAEENKKAAP